MGIFKFISNLFTPAVNAFDRYQGRKAEVHKAKHQLKLAKIGAETKRFELQQAATTNWDMEAMRQSQFSWKDEVLMIILFAPFIASFIPGLQEHVKAGFVLIGDLPIWYQSSLVGIIAASFGLRWLFQGKIKKMTDKGH